MSRSAGAIFLGGRREAGARLEAETGAAGARWLGFRLFAKETKVGEGKQGQMEATRSFSMIDL